MADDSREMIRPVKDGCRIRLRVKAKASREEILGSHGAALKVAVKQPPEKGRANQAVCELLARALRMPLASVRLVAGESSQDKVVGILGLDAGECRRRLLAYLEDCGIKNRDEAV